MADVKLIVAVPGFHDADVDAFVQVPAIVHASDPKAMYELTEEMFAFPLTVTLPEVDVRPPPLIVREPADRVFAPLARTPPERVSAFVTAMLFPSVTVPPDTESAGKVLWAGRVVTVPVALNVYTLVVPAFHVEPAPDVFQLPATVQAPVVTVRVPVVPPVIVALDTVTVEAFAVRMPPFPTLRAPPANPRPPVASSVVETPSAIDRVPPHRRAFVLIVNVTGVAEDDEKVTLPPNSWARLPNVIVAFAADVNVTGAANDHDAEGEEVVQEPVTDEEPPAAEVM